MANQRETEMNSFRTKKSPTVLIVDDELTGRMEVARLIVLAPEDRSGKKVFSNWSRLLEIDEQEAPSTLTRSSLTLKDVLATPLDIFEPDFPGVNEVISQFEDRIYAEAKRRFKKNNAVARVLNVSKSTASTNLKRIEKLP